MNTFEIGNRIVSPQEFAAHVNKIIDGKETRIKELEALLLESKRDHDYCEDSWYSCPKAEDGCSNECYDEDECICGADRWNAKVDAALRTSV